MHPILNRHNLILLLILSFSFIFSAIHPIDYRSGNILISADEKDIHYAEKIAEALNYNIDRFQRKIGQYPDIPVKIKIASDNEEYQEFSGSSSAIIEFSQAFFDPTDKTIYLRNPAKLRNFEFLNRILLHEYIHLFVRTYWFNPPLWFNEGMAVYFSYDLNLDREFNFVINYIMGNSRSLNAMKRRYPENRIEWESFYAKSGLAVKYLYNKKRNGFYSLWERSGAERDFNKSFFRAFFLTQDQFSRMFEEYSRSHFTMEILLASTGLIWMIFPLILLIGGIRKKFRNKKIEQLWEEESIKFDEFETNGE